MPRTKSAQKAWRQNKRRRERNLAYKNAVKNKIKSYKKLLAREKTELATAELKKVYQVLDKIAKAKYIKKRKANRLKSRLAKRLNKKSA